ncbi:MAG: DUF58 domain-containing protein [Candidatus Omnitrophica bacterium]|nr:DUF58 domain-containing protein [Candidatus Omnitrophota bacterium]
MIPSHILEKIRRIHITTTRLAANIFAGEYKSVFKGRGLEFHEVREYMVGDEIRSIDWNVTARAGKPFVKKFIEERELTIMVLLDVSRSTHFGTVNTLKRDLAAEISSVLAASANRNNDRVGLIIFSDRIEKYIAPRKGRRHILQLVRETLYHEPQGTRTDIPMALEYLNRVTTRSAIVFLISDFYASRLKTPLTIANKRHDVIAIRIMDPVDRELPDAGIIGFTDAETGKQYFLDTSKRAVRDAYRKAQAARSKELSDLFNATRIDTITIDTKKSYTESLIQFFNTRKARRRLG